MIDTDMAEQADNDYADFITNAKVAAFCIFWLPIQLILSIKIDYPNSFGVHIEERGRIGAIKDFWYSYLLLERHHLLDIVTFIWMWLLVVVVFVGGALPIVRAKRRNNQTKG